MTILYVTLLAACLFGIFYTPKLAQAITEPVVRWMMPKTRLRVEIVLEGNEVPIRYEYRGTSEEIRDMIEHVPEEGTKIAGRTVKRARTHVEPQDEEALFIG